MAALAGIPKTLTVEDYMEVYRKVYKARAKWWEIGAKLGVAHHDLEYIKANHGSTEACYAALLNHWLKTVVTLEPTWEKMLAALRHETVQHKDLAASIEGLPTYASPKDTRWWIQGGLAVLIMTILWMLPSLLQWTFCQPMSLTLRAPVKHFVGRVSEIDDIVEWFQIFAIVSIVGPPGFGKSALSTMVGHRLLDEGNTVIYIDMRKVMDPIDIMLWVLHGVDITDATSDRMVEQRFRKWASRLTCVCPVVIILDECDGMFHADKDNLYQSIKTLVEASPSIRILTTSRTRFPLPDTHHYSDLHELDLDSAAVLLSKLHPPLNHTQIYQIVHVTGGMPLALKVVGTLLNYTITPEKVIAELQDQQDVLIALNHSDLPAELRLESCIEYSYNMLDHRLKVLSQYVAGFPSFFTSESAYYIAKISALNLTRTDCGEMLDELVIRSLLQFHRESKQYYFHSFVRSFIHQRKNETISKIFEVMFASYHLHSALYDKGDSVHLLYVYDIIIEQNWFPERKRYFEDKRKRIKFFAKTWNRLLHPHLIQGSTPQCSEWNYTGCVELLKHILEQTPSSSGIMKTSLFYLLLNVQFHIDSELELEPEGAKLYPILMATPNADLLEAELYGYVLVVLQGFYIDMQRAEWACSLMGKNVAVWESSTCVMDFDFEEAVFGSVETCCEHWNITTINRIRGALIEHKRRVQRSVKENLNARQWPVTDLDLAEHNEQWVRKVAEMELHIVYCTMQPTDINYFRVNATGHVLNQMRRSLLKWGQLHVSQLLEELVGQVYYKSIKLSMEQYQRIWASIRDRTPINFNEFSQSLLLQVRPHFEPRAWYNINHWIVLTQDLRTFDLQSDQKENIKAKIECIVKARSLDIIANQINVTLWLLELDGITMANWVGNQFNMLFKSLNEAKESVSPSCINNYVAYASELKEFFN